MVGFFENRALAQLTTAINEGDTESALSLIKPDMPLDAVAKGHYRSPLFAAVDTGAGAADDRRSGRAARDRGHPRLAAPRSAGVTCGRRASAAGGVIPIEQGVPSECRGGI